MPYTSFADYQAAALTTAAYPDSERVTYPALGLVSEAGEVAGKIKKRIRDGKPDGYREQLLDELGDVCWYVAVLARDMGIDAAGFDARVSHIGWVAYEIEPEHRIAVGLAVRVAEAATCAMTVGAAAAPEVAVLLGGVLSRCQAIAATHDAALTEVLDRNIAKLASRKARGVIQGSGDHR